MALRIIRLHQLCNYEPRPEPDDKPQAKDGQPKKRKEARVGLLGVGKSKLHEHYLLRDPADPLIPGTDVPRLKLIYLGPKTPATTEDEVDRVVKGLQRWAAKAAAERDRQRGADATALR